MTSPIYLGGTQMCEHGLGSYLYNTQGSGWSGTGFTGRVSLVTLPITIKNPSGSALIGGFVDLSFWTSTVGSVVQGSVSSDGGAQALFSKFAFNRAGEHVQFTYGFYAGYFGPGAHTIDLGLYVVVGSFNLDPQDGGTFAVWEQA